MAEADPFTGEPAASVVQQHLVQQAVDVLPTSDTSAACVSLSDSFTSELLVAAVLSSEIELVDAVVYKVPLIAGADVNTQVMCLHLLSQQSACCCCC